jgi:hypothetical protein
MCLSPPEEQSSTSALSLSSSLTDVASADGFAVADGSRSDPSGELGLASVLAIDFYALRRAYLLERVCGKVGVKGIDGAPGA